MLRLVGCPITLNLATRCVALPAIHRHATIALLLLFMSSIAVVVVAVVVIVVQ